MTLHVDGAARHLRTTTLALDLETGPPHRARPAARARPRRLARSRTWCRLVDPVARMVRHGVRTTGTAGHGRREWYCATDEHRVVRAVATLDAVALGGLRPVVPPVRFGFASTPPEPGDRAGHDVDRRAPAGDAGGREPPDGAATTW